MAQNEMRRIRILVKHAEPLVTLGLVTALRQHPDLEVLERSGDQAARQVLLHLTREAPQEWMRQDARQALLRLERRPGQ